MTAARPWLPDEPEGAMLFGDWEEADDARIRAHDRPYLREVAGRVMDKLVDGIREQGLEPSIYTIIVRPAQEGRAATIGVKMLVPNGESVAA